jgi:hypothetical protein
MPPLIRHITLFSLPLFSIIADTPFSFSSLFSMMPPPYFLHFTPRRRHGFSRLLSAFSFATIFFAAFHISSYAFFAAGITALPRFFRIFSRFHIERDTPPLR